MGANGVAASSAATGKSLLALSKYKINTDGKKVSKVRLKSLPTQRKQSEINGITKQRANASRSASPVVPKFDNDTTDNLPVGQYDTLDTVICKHCKKMVLKRTAKDHVGGCLKSKQEKQRKKKEAREAAARAKERAERAEEDDDDDDDIKDGKGRKAANGEDSKGKKRKADGDDDRDSKKKKTKKEEQKAKAAKPKGPVDVERQCGVTLPNGQQCARSLTCKSHSMGAKRAVPGRSLPYDMLLAAYQKKNQARQQKAAIDANAPALLEDELDNMGGPVDSDEERDAVMTAISRNISRPQPLFNSTLFPTRRKYQLVRMKEMLSNALSGNRNGNLFGVPYDSGRSAYPMSTTNDTFAIPISASSAIGGGGSSQTAMKAPSRKASVEVG